MTRLLLLVAAIGCSSERDGTGTAWTASGTGVGTGSTIPVFEVLSDERVHDAASDQHHLTVSADGAGRTLMLWDDDLGGHGVWSRLYDDDHQPLTDARAAIASAPNPSRPDGAATSAGWGIAYGYPYDVYLAGLDTEGTSLSVAERRVNEQSGEDLDRGQPDVAWLGDSLVIVYHLAWPDQDPYSRYFAHRVDADLLSLGPSWEIGTSVHVGSPPDVAGVPGGGFVVAWVYRSPEGNEVRLSRYDAQERLVWVERADASAVGDNPSRPAVVVAESGEMLVSWRQNAVSGQALGSFVRVMAADGAWRSEPVLLDPAGDRSVVAAGAGLLLCAWESRDEVLIQAIDTDTGQPLGEALAPSGEEGYLQERPSLAILEQGQVVVGYEVRVGDVSRVRRAVLGVAR